MPLPNALKRPARSLHHCLAIALLLGIFGGCQPQRTTDLEAVPELSDYLVGPTRPVGDATLPPASAVFSDSQTVEYQRIDPGNHPATFTETIRRVEDLNAPLRRNTVTEQIQHLKLADDGSVVMTAVEDTEHNVLTRFATPVPLYRHDLKPGEPHEVTSDLKVMSRADPSQQVDSGTCRVTLKLEGAQTLRTPAGVFDAFRVRHEYSGQFSVAKVTTVSTLYIAPEAGIVAVHYEEQGNALFLPWSKQYTLVREREE